MSDYLTYLKEYDKAISDFVFEMDSEEQSNRFLRSFFETCSNMLINLVDLSDKQHQIIEREMRNQKRVIPQLDKKEIL